MNLLQSADLHFQVLIDHSETAGVYFISRCRHATDEYGNSFKISGAVGCLKVHKVHKICTLEAKGITKLGSYTNQRNTQVMSDLDQGTYIRTQNDSNLGAFQDQTTSLRK